MILNHAVASVLNLKALLQALSMLVLMLRADQTASFFQQQDVGAGRLLAPQLCSCSDAALTMKPCLLMPTARSVPIDSIVFSTRFSIIGNLYIAHPSNVGQVPSCIFVVKCTHLSMHQLVHFISRPNYVQNQVKHKNTVDYYFIITNQFLFLVLNSQDLVESDAYHLYVI